MKEIVSLNGKSIEAIVTVVPKGVNLTNNHDGTITAYGKKQTIEEFKKKISLAPSSQNPIQTLGKYTLSLVNFTEKMWREYKEIKNSRRPVVIVFACYVEFLIDELSKEFRNELREKFGDQILHEYGEGRKVYIGLEKKAERLNELNIIDKKLCLDLKLIWKIRTKYAHSIFICDSKEEKFFKEKVGNFRCIEDAVPKKNVSVDVKFGKCCYHILSQLGRKYYEKIYPKSNII